MLLEHPPDRLEPVEVADAADRGEREGRENAVAVAEDAAGGERIVFLGDSITHFWEGAGKDVWKKYFARGRYKALNLGFSADRTEHVLWRIANGEFDGYEAKAIVIVMFGGRENVPPIFERK